LAGIAEKENIMRNSIGRPKKIGTMKKNDDLKGFKLVGGRLEKYDASGNRIVADPVLQMQGMGVFYVRYGFENPVKDKLEILGLSAGDIWSAFYRLDQASVDTFVKLNIGGLVEIKDLAGVPVPENWSDASQYAWLLNQYAGPGLDLVESVLSDFIIENRDDAPCVGCNPVQCNFCWFNKYSDLIDDDDAGDDEQHLRDVLAGDALVKRVPFSVPNPL